MNITKSTLKCGGKVHKNIQKQKKKTLVTNLYLFNRNT